MGETKTQPATRWRTVALFLLLAAISTGTALYLSGGSALFTAQNDVGETPRSLKGDDLAEANAPRLPLTLPEEQEVVSLTQGRGGVTHADPKSNEIELALRAALSDEETGAIALQKYFDQAAGHPQALRERGGFLITALSNRSNTDQPTKAVERAAQRIYQAIDTVAETAYVLPAEFQDNHRLSSLHKGWDIGPLHKEAYKGYERPEITKDGANKGVRFFEDSAESLLINDGAYGLRALSLPSVQGSRQIIILSLVEGNTDNPQPLIIENREARVIGAHSDIDGWGLKYVNFTSEGILEQQRQDRQNAVKLQATVIPSVPVLGALDLGFSQSQNAIVGVLVSPTEMPQVVSDLKNDLRPLLGAETTRVTSNTGAPARRSPSSTQGQASDDLSSLKEPVTVDGAIAGAIAGTPDGIERLQKFMDAAAGDLDRLKTRALALLDALGQSSVSDDFIALADTANRILDATSQASSSAYILPAFLSDDFQLPADQSGWDFGPKDKPPFSKFMRIGETSTFVRGTNIVAIDRMQGPAVAQDALKGVNGFFPDLPDGIYRFLLLAPTTMDGEKLDQPFGFGLRVGGASARLVDLSDTHPLIWGRFNGNSIAIQGGLEGPTPESVLEAARQGTNGSDPSADAMLVAVRGSVDGGRLRLEFDLTEGQNSVVAAIIAGLSDPSDLEEFLADQIAILLAETETAAGPGAIAGAFLEPGTIPALPPIGRSTPNAPAPSASGGTGGGTGGGGTGGIGGGTGGGTDGGATDGGTTDGGTTDGGTTDGGDTDGGATDGGTTDGGTTDGGDTDGGDTDGGATDGGTTDGGATDGGDTDGGATDGGTTDGGTTDGGDTDGGATDGGTTDGGTTDGGTTDGGTTDGGATDGGDTDGGATDGGTTDGGATDGGATDGGTTDGGGATDGGDTDGGATDGGTTDGGTTDGGTTDGGATDGGTTDGGATDGGDTDGGATDGGTTDGGATDGGDTDGGATDGGTTDGGATDGGDTDGGDPLLSPDPGGPYTVFAGDTFSLDGTDSLFEVDDPSLLSIDWLVNVNGQSIFLATGFGSDLEGLTPNDLSLATPGQFDLTLRFSYLNLVEQAVTFIQVLPRNGDIPVPATILLGLPGFIGIWVLSIRRRRRKL